MLPAQEIIGDAHGKLHTQELKWALQVNRQQLHRDNINVKHTLRNK